jgi:hypothetical protein
MDLNGEVFDHEMSITHFNLLLFSAAQDVDEEEGSLIYILRQMYVTYKANHPRGDTFVTFILNTLSNDLDTVWEGRERIPYFDNDVRELTEILTRVDNEQRYCVE